MALADTNPGLWNWLLQAPSNNQGGIDTAGYAAKRPDLKANWDNNPEIQQIYGNDFNRYLTDDYFRASNGPSTMPEFNTSDPSTKVNNPPTDNPGTTGGGTTGGGGGGTSGGGGGGTSGGVGTGLGGLIDQGTLDSILKSLGQGNVNGGNTDQTSGSSQSGGFTTDNTTGQKTDQQTKGTVVSNGSTTSNGTTNQTNVGSTNTNTSGTSTQEVVDKLGLGDLIKSQTAGTAASDEARRNFLTDTMQTGGSQFQSQLDQGIRSSLTGPQMTNAGDSARARAAGYSAAQTGRNNLDERLAASSQLAGPTGSGTLVQQGSPLLGKTTTDNSSTIGTSLNNLVGTNTNTGTSNNTDTTNMDTAGAMSGTSNTDGTATGSSLSHSFGNTPIAQQSSGGGCFVCSALATVGKCDPEDVRMAVRYKLYKRRSKNMPVGYSLYGPLLAKLVLRYSLVQRLVGPLALRVLEEELRLAGKVSGFSFLNWALHFSWHYSSGALGFVARCFGATFKTRDTAIFNMLKSNNLFFSK